MGTGAQGRRMLNASLISLIHNPTELSQTQHIQKCLLSTGKAKAPLSALESSYLACCGINPMSVSSFSC